MSAQLQDAITLAADLYDSEIIASDPLEHEICMACDALKVATDSFEQRVLYRKVQALHDRRTAEMIERLERVRGLRK